MCVCGGGGGGGRALGRCDFVDLWGEATLETVGRGGAMHMYRGMGTRKRSKLTAVEPLDRKQERGGAMCNM